MFLDDAVSPTVNVKLSLDAILNQAPRQASSGQTVFQNTRRIMCIWPDAASVCMNNTQNF